MTRQEAVAKAVEYMNKTFGPVRESRDQDKWHESLGMIVDFISTLYDEQEHEEARPDTVLASRREALCLRYDGDCPYNPSTRNLAGCHGPSTGVIVSCYVEPPFNKPTGPTPPDGYRLLRSEEVVEPGDVCWTGYFWKSVSKIDIGSAQSNTFARRIATDAPAKEA